MQTVQAYGARQFELVGVSLQRGSLICLTAFLMLLPVWLNFEPIMIAMGAWTHCGICCVNASAVACWIRDARVADMCMQVSNRIWRQAPLDICKS
jgi:hypothetical protein